MQAAGWKIYKKLLMLLILFSSLVIPQAATRPAAFAQMSTETHTFAWRSAGLIMQYPVDWLDGEYQGHPLLVSSADGLEKASSGGVPNTPALTFLHYPQAGNISPTELLLLIFPNQTAAPLVIGGKDGVSAQFADEVTDQTIWVAGFESPLLNQAHLIVAGAPTETWAEFEPRLQTMILSVRFLGETASLEFAGGLVTFNYPEDWFTASNGQVVVASAEQSKATAILAGDLAQAPPFIRSQLLVPSGIGIDPTNAQAPRQILETFAGQTLTSVIEFEWGGGLPAALAQVELEGLNLLLLAVISGDHALLMGGGATTEDWPTARVWIDGALHMTVYNEQTAPRNLEDIIAGDNSPFGMVQ